jgi:hypothetical protein
MGDPDGRPLGKTDAGGVSVRPSYHRRLPDHRAAGKLARGGNTCIGLTWIKLYRAGRATVCSLDAPREEPTNHAPMGDYHEGKRRSQEGS